MTVRFLHISDTHMGVGDDYVLPNAPTVMPFPRAKRLVDWINQRSEPIDFVVHTGDVANLGQRPGDDGRSTLFGAELLRTIKYPLHVVNGNNDNREVLSACFDRDDELHSQVELGRRDYQFHVGGEHFYVIDARGDLSHDPGGILLDQQTQSLSLWFDQTNGPVTLFMHYPPIALDSKWIDQTMIVKNGERLHRLLSDNSKRVRGVFFGHIHRGIQVLRDGVLYCAVGAASVHFDAWPEQPKVEVNDSNVSFANYVCVGENGTLVKQYWTGGFA